MLAASGLVFGYGVRAVLAGAGLEVGRGEVLALLGPNGAGKSTLLRLLAGLLRPQAGQVWWWGRSPQDARAPRRRVGVIGHGSYLFDDLTAQENLAYYARLLGLDDPGG
ncbi:ABC transporter-like domain protein, partial [mine drainage metagenome]